MRGSSRIGLASSVLLAALLACSGSNPGSGFEADGGGSSSGGSSGGSGGGSGGIASDPDSGHLGGSSGGDDGGGPQGDATVTVTTTIYANTDDTLFSMDPKSNSVASIGKFTGMGGGTNDSTITDVAVNAVGDVYVNSESVVYRAALPSAAGGNVALTKVASIQTTQRFYALAFTPLDALGSGTGEVLIGGDGSGELWAIDPAGGTTKDLGDFGPDPDDATRFLSLSGDLVFYLDSANTPTGLATIRSCAPPAKAGNAPTCTKTNDVLAGVSMTELAKAYTTGTPSKSLNGGMYGGSATSKGPGTGKGELFGLGAWEGNVYGFSRNMSSPTTPPSLYAISTQSGSANSLPGTFAFTNGWSGAGVTTTVTVTVSPPPPPPPPPK